MSVPRFSDCERDAELQAYKAMSSIPEVIFLSEVQVLKAVGCFISQIGRCIFGLPIRAFREFRYSITLFLSMLIPLCLVHAAGFSFCSGFEFARQQPIYKLWSIYGLLWVVISYLAKVHKQTHLILRSSIANNNNLLLPVFWHSVSNLLIFVCLSIDAGTFIAGLFGKAGLFFTACVQTQGIILKKFLPKPLNPDPAAREPSHRLLVALAVAVHLTCGGNLRDIAFFIELDWACALARWVVLSMTSDGIGFYEHLRETVNSFTQECRGGVVPFEKSIIFRIPIEAFAMAVISLSLLGPTLVSLLLVSISGFAWAFA